MSEASLEIYFKTIGYKILIKNLKNFPRLS